MQMTAIKRMDPERHQLLIKLDPASSSLMWGPGLRPPVNSVLTWIWLASSMSTMMGFIEFLTTTPCPSPDAWETALPPLDDQGDQGGSTEMETGGATMESDPSHSPQGNLRQGVGCCEAKLWEDWLQFFQQAALRRVERTVGHVQHHPSPIRHPPFRSARSVLWLFLQQDWLYPWQPGHALLWATNLCQFWWSTALSVWTGDQQTNTWTHLKVTDKKLHAWSYPYFPHQKQCLDDLVSLIMFIVNASLQV